MASPCSTSCFDDDSRIAMYTACDDDTRESGISHLIYAHCSFAFNATVDLAAIGGVGTVVIGAADDPDAWTDAIDSGLMIVTPEGLGEKPGTEKAKKKRFSCRPEATISKTHTVQFESDIVDTTVDATTYTFDDFELYDLIDTNENTYRVGWIGCDGLIYMNSSVEGAFATGGSGEDNPFYEAAIDIDYIKANDAETETDKYTHEISFKERGIVRGYQIPLVNTAILTQSPPVLS